MGNDLAPVSSVKFMPGSDAFMTTNTPMAASRHSRNRSEVGGKMKQSVASTFKSRKPSHNPTSATLDYLSRQEDKQRFEPAKTTKNADNKVGSLTQALKPHQSVRHMEKQTNNKKLTLDSPNSPVTNSFLMNEEFA